MDKPIEKALEEYIAMVYPRKLSPIQHKEIRQAFYAGFLECKVLLLKMSELEDPKPLFNAIESNLNIIRKEYCAKVSNNAN